MTSDVKVMYFKPRDFINCVCGSSIFPTIIDIRSENDFKNSHVGTAVNCDLSSLTRSSDIKSGISERLDAVPRLKSLSRYLTILVYGNKEQFVLHPCIHSVLSERSLSPRIFFLNFPYDQFYELYPYSDNRFVSLKPPVRLQMLPCEILPNLFLGQMLVENTADLLLKAFRITHVLNCAIECSYTVPAGIKMFHLEINDDPSVCFPIDAGVQFIESAFTSSCHSSSDSFSFFFPENSPDLPSLISPPPSSTSLSYSSSFVPPPLPPRPSLLSSSSEHSFHPSQPLHSDSISSVILLETNDPSPPLPPRVPIPRPLSPFYRPSSALSSVLSSSNPSPSIPSPPPLAIATASEPLSDSSSSIPPPPPLLFDLSSSIPPPPPLSDPSSSIPPPPPLSDPSSSIPPPPLSDSNSSIPPPPLPDSSIPPPPLSDSSIPPPPFSDSNSSIPPPPPLSDPSSSIPPPPPLSDPSSSIPPPPSLSDPSSSIHPPTSLNISSEASSSIPPPSSSSIPPPSSSSIPPPSSSSTPSSSFSVSTSSSASLTSSPSSESSSSSSSVYSPSNPSFTSSPPPSDSSQPRVFVHCQMGISRSATAVISYIMWKFRLTARESLQVVRTQRATVNPNKGFVRQLLVYEERLRHEGRIEPDGVRDKYDFAKFSNIPPVDVENLFQF